jgi:hypothetical protein
MSMTEIGRKTNADMRERRTTPTKKQAKRYMTNENNNINL